MKILKLEWRNLFSYGNKIVSVDLTEPGRLWQISGRSGSGKSSFLNMTKLLIYGKVDGPDGKPMKVSSIANRTNGNGWVRGVLQKGDDEYVIERTFSPQSVSILKNGNPIERAGMKDVQGVIESEVMEGMTYAIFSNVMILSLNNFKSFVSMSASDKRGIIDRIFSLDVINKMSEYVRNDMKEKGNSINTMNSQIFSMNNMVKSSRAELEKINESSFTEEDAERISQLKKDIESYNDKLSKVESLLEKYHTTNKEMTRNYQEKTDALSQKTIEATKIDSGISNIRRKIDLYNMDKCPTCGADFKSGMFTELLDSLKAEKKRLDDEFGVICGEISEMKTSVSELKSKLDTISGDIYKIDKKRMDIYKDMNFAQREVDSLNAKKNTPNGKESIEKIIGETELSVAEMERGVKESSEDMRLLGILQNAYSADGIKGMMMGRFLPEFNMDIAETLSEIGFPYELVFDNSFDAHVYSYGKEIDMQSVSFGENKRINVAVLCAIMKMIKRRYTDMNMVCLDEVVSSLDYETSCDVIKYLRNVAKDMELNVFIVSHTALDEDMFDVRIDVEKVNGFTEVKTVFKK